MANLRSQLRLKQGITPPQPQRTPVRWPWLAGGALAALLLLAWFDGGEKPLRPIAEPVQLPELPR